jgi:hypothetical protein
VDEWLSAGGGFMNPISGAHWQQQMAQERADTCRSAPHGQEHASWKNRKSQE